MGMRCYYRPIVQYDRFRPDGAVALAGGELWFSHAEKLERGVKPERVAVHEIPADVLERLTAPRREIAGLSMSGPMLMGILNVTPDSFSDGGLHAGPAMALAHAKKMRLDGADIIDIGGESTRPGSVEVPIEAEIARTVPAITAIRSAMKTPLSIDTRKAEVARAAVSVGANVINDVSGFTFDPELAPYCAKAGLPVCIMHAQGLPQTMQDDPQYEDVLLDVYDFLEDQIAKAEALGIARSAIITDPGIGFGKTLKHNLTLLNGISLFHGLGCPILLGASRKGMIKEIGAAPDPHDRAPGSIAVALAAVAQGVQILRVHDVKETRQALNLWQAVTRGTV